MIGERQDVHDDRGRRAARRRTLHVPQPGSTAALRPSQRRAAEHRAERDRERAVERWLRRIAERVP
jgi:hypothetical protein